MLKMPQRIPSPSGDGDVLYYQTKEAIEKLGMSRPGFDNRVKRFNERLEARLKHLQEQAQRDGTNPPDLNDPFNQIIKKRRRGRDVFISEFDVQRLNSFDDDEA